MVPQVRHCRSLLLVTALLAPLGPLHAQGMGHGHGGDGRGHDMARMPGLQGVDTTPQETAEMAAMFRGFTNMTRWVTPLPDGYTSVTYSADPDLMAAIASHVTGMIARLEEGRDPKVVIQSPTLELLFDRHDRIETVVEMTDAGIVVTQTSEDPEVVAALKTHADEVTDMSFRGMHAVHERMRRDAEN